MKFVIDASVVLAVVLDEPERPWAIAATVAGEAIAPQSFPFEIGNALAALLKRKRLTESGMQAAWTAAQRFKVSLRDIDMAAALRLAASHGTCAYDAYMLQCALEHRGTLVTLDRRMIAVGKLIGLGISELPK